MKRDSLDFNAYPMQYTKMYTYKIPATLRNLCLIIRLVWRKNKDESILRNVELMLV